MSATSLACFQRQVSELLLRHKSILDILSKCDQAGASVHRSVIKAVTECGCIKIDAEKQAYSPDLTLEQARDVLSTHMTGSLCDTCKEIIGDQLGKQLFYIASLCNVLNIELDQVVADESSKCSALGVFRMA